ncbi:hypothetical protein KOW79_012672 [Hemibagrus wyckioides]|uniref:Uncharacterized protein n=1 Tax=Hemibagrus wyckioides TaxID=337641 RepID=A0A9D3NJF2_9TELE|nr:hypothetical protein KOW79_012672 [Hemibagrus wyckioides]
MNTERTRQQSRSSKENFPKSDKIHIQTEYSGAMKSKELQEALQSLECVWAAAHSLTGSGLGDEVEEEMELSIISNIAANRGPELLLSIITALMHDTLDSSCV